VVVGVDVQWDIGVVQQWIVWRSVAVDQWFRDCVDVHYVDYGG
jgi:hypothetical protein